MVTGRPLKGAPPQRHAVSVFVLHATHLKLRLIAETEGITIGALVDALVAERAERHGISLGRAS